MSYRSSGAATPHRLFMEMFLKMVGGKAQHVPYRGSVAALTDVIFGRHPFMIVDLRSPFPRSARARSGPSASRRQRGSRRCRYLHHRGGRRARLRRPPWFSVVAPAGTPRPIIDRLNRVLMAFINRPDTQDKMNALAITPWTSTPDELAQFIPAEIKKWAQVVKDAGITPE